MPDDQVQGVVSEVRVHLVVSGGGGGGGVNGSTSSSVTSREVLSFVIGAGGPRPTVVEWRPKHGRRINQAPVEVGDVVRVTGHRSRRKVLATLVENETRGLSYEGANVHRQTLAGLVLFAAFAIVILLVFGGMGIAGVFRSGGSSAPAAPPATVASTPLGEAAPGPSTASPVPGASTASGGGAVTVPAVSGLTNVAAAERFVAVDLQPSFVEVASPSTPFGTAVTSTPPAGAHVARGSIVEIEMSCGHHVAGICPPG